MVDHKQVYELMWTLRRQIKAWITQLVNKTSAVQIKKNLFKIFQRYSLSLKAVFETEAAKICSALEKNEKVIVLGVPNLELLRLSSHFCFGVFDTQRSEQS